MPERVRRAVLSERGQRLADIRARKKSDARIRATRPLTLVMLQCEVRKDAQDKMYFVFHDRPLDALLQRHPLPERFEGWADLMYFLNGLYDA